MAKISSTTQCRALFEYLNKAPQKREFWRSQAERIAVKSFGDVRTMEVINKILDLNHKIQFSFYAQEHIKNLFSMQDGLMLSAWLKVGIKNAQVIFNISSERTTWRRMQKLSERVLRHCDPEVLNHAMSWYSGVDSAIAKESMLKSFLRNEDA